MNDKKDPRRQWQGYQAKINGKHFEERLEATFNYYKSRGSALIEKTPEPMRVVKSVGGGKFIAFFEKKAQPDYKGILPGGRMVVIEAKYTTAAKMEQNRVRAEQSEYMDSYAKLGARCYVVAGFSSGNVYRIPWDDWNNMKTIYGRKYVTETDIEKFKVKTAWNGTLLLL